MWVQEEKLPRRPVHSFDERLNRVREKAAFDAFVEGLGKCFYAYRLGWPRLRPETYFQMLQMCYFEGLDSEPAIAAGWLTR